MGAVAAGGGAAAGAGASLFWNSETVAVVAGSLFWNIDSGFGAASVFWNIVAVVAGVVIGAKFTIAGAEVDAIVPNNPVEGLGAAKLSAGAGVETLVVGKLSGLLGASFFSKVNDVLKIGWAGVAGVTVSVDVAPNITTGGFGASSTGFTSWGLTSASSFSFSFGVSFILLGMPNMGAGAGATEFCLGKPKVKVALGASSVFSLGASG